MPQQTDAAVPTRLEAIEASLVGRKLRVAGRMLSYDTDTQLVIVIDGEDALLVDVSLCVDPWTGPWIRERLCKVMTLGHLESADDQLAIPTLPNFAPAPSVDPHLVLRAILITPVPDLDLNLWNASIKEMEASIDSDEMSPFPSSQVHIE